VLGLAPGRSDTYEPQLEGQAIPITPGTAPTGTYTLAQTVDPHHRLRRTTRANDAASILLQIAWPRSTGLPRLHVLRACPDAVTCGSRRPRA
jgi:hypothetical protein